MFLILGVFGSCAAGDFSSESDLDILYKLDKRFYKEYIGWKAIEHLAGIKGNSSLLFDLDVDIANINSIKSMGRNIFYRRQCMSIRSGTGKLEQILLYITAKPPVPPAIEFSNFITHNYDGIDLIIVENTIRNQMPELKYLIISILGDI